MTIKFMNPFEDLFAAAEDVAGKELNCEVHFGLIEDALGYTLFPDDGSEPVICIHPNQNIEQCLDILAHELAHVIRGKNDDLDDHCDLWKSLYDQIFFAYNERVLSYEKLKESINYKNI